MAASALVAAPGVARGNSVEDSLGPYRLDAFELPSPLVDASTPGGELPRGRKAPKTHVLLPADYDEHPDRDYPVLWLLHGANGGTDTWIPDIAKLAGDDFPGIIVMPDGGVFGMYMNWWNGGRRADPAWATYHLELLRDTIEDRYRIRPGRSWHAIGGISMGGQGALRYAAMLPGYFGSVATFSAAMPDMRPLESQAGLALIDLLNGDRGAGHAAIYGPADGPYAEGTSARALVRNLEHTRIYLTSGWGLPCLQDPVRWSGVLVDAVTEAVLHTQQIPFALAAQRAGADVTHVTTCGVHTFEVWDRAIPAAFDWGFFADVPEQPDRWSYRTIAATGEMWGLQFELAQPPSEVVEFRRRGDTLVGIGAGDVRIDGPNGCRLRVTLPFTRDLPGSCLRSM